MTGRDGTADSSQLLFACTFATVLSPAARASCQCRLARGPGPTADRLYSPTVAFTPPRSSGRDHSLTDMSQHDFGSRAIVGPAQSSGQPQSQAMTLAFGLPRWTPASMVALTSAMTSGPVRALQRGHDSGWWC